MKAKNQTPETTTIVFKTSHAARTQAAEHMKETAAEAGLRRTEAYRDNEKGTDHATWTLPVPAEHADDTARSIAQDLTANGIETTWTTEPETETETPETETLTLTTPDTFCSAQIKALAALAGFTRTDETTWTRTATKAEADRIFYDLPKVLHKEIPEGTEWHLRREKNSPETPETAAAKFWEDLREGYANQGHNTSPECTQADLETWLHGNATSQEHREKTRKAILAQAEPTNLPLITPRFTESDLRDLWSDTQKDHEAADRRANKLEEEIDELKEKIEELEEESNNPKNPNTGNTWEDDLEEAQEKAEEAEKALTNPETDNSWEDDFDKAKEELEEEREAHKRTKDQLTATIDSHNEKYPDYPSERDWLCLEALVRADMETGNDEARTIYRDRHVIQAKLKMGAKLTPEEASDLLSLVSQVDDTEIPWTQQDCTEEVKKEITEL